VRDRGMGFCLFGSVAIAARYARTRHELEPLLTGLHRQPSLLHDVGLVLRMGVKWWRCVAWKEELDQREAPVARLAQHLDRCQGAQEPQLLTLPRA